MFRSDSEEIRQDLARHPVSFFKLLNLSSKSNSATYLAYLSILFCPSAQRIDQLTGTSNISSKDTDGEKATYFFIFFLNLSTHFTAPHSPLAITQSTSYNSHIKQIHFQCFSRRHYFPRSSFSPLSQLSLPPSPAYLHLTQPEDRCLIHIIKYLLKNGLLTGVIRPSWSLQR